jgi:uncharacterized protein YjbJ (UPF0337 family)
MDRQYGRDLIMECESTHGEIQMNRDQVKGRAREMAGKVQKAVGRAFGSRKTEGKGIAKEVTGKVQKTVGDVRHDLRDLR